MIIDAYPREGVPSRTKAVYQYDYGQIIRIHLNDLPAAYKVEFSNSTRADAISTVQTTDEVVIPAAFLTAGTPVYCWIVVVDEESRTTEYALTVPVTVRARPTDQEPAPEEQTEIEQTLAALNGAVEDADQAAADAREAASHYPDIFNGTWWLWDAEGGVYVNTGIEARGPQGDPGAVFTPSVSDQGVISWANNGGLPNPQSRNIKGPAGAVYTPSVSEQGVISWTNDGGLPNPTERNIKGGKGDDGVSPIITVAAITGGHRITITDAAHPQGQTVDVMDGVAGSDGRGIVSISKTGTAGLVDTYTITYSSGSPTIFTVTNGADGISPTVTTEAIPGGHRVTVEDGEGAHSFDVLDGPAQFAETDSAGQDSGFMIGY